MKTCSITSIIAAPTTICGYSKRQSISGMIPAPLRVGLFLVKVQKTVEIFKTLCYTCKKGVSP